MLTDTSRLYIVKQPNGKYALFSGTRNNFFLTNCKTPTEIIDFILERTEARLRCNVFAKPKYFNCALEKYKQARGFKSEAVNELSDGAVELLTSMGVPEDTLEKKPGTIPYKYLNENGSGNGLTMGQKLKIIELVMGDPSVTAWPDDTQLEKKYRQIRDLVLEDHAK